ncbi:MAG: hypothetical protein AB4911_22795 [Oscillochloridaceae bacterium umkhey_bin13]
MLRWAALGALLIVVLSQIPVLHQIQVGSRDAAYLQGFHAAEGAGSPDLAGVTNARWSRAEAAVRLPQAGLPGTVSLRLRRPTPAPLIVRLNGTTPLLEAQVGPEWVTLTTPIQGGWLKASDFFLTLDTPPTTLPDGRVVGALLTEVVYQVGPGLILPYPSQLIYGALVGGMLALLLPSATIFGQPQRRVIMLALLLYGLLWLFGYRLPTPITNYPLLNLPLWVVGGLLALLSLRYGSWLSLRWPWLIRVAAPLAVIGLWTALTLVHAQHHVTLSRPGVENDFRVFATRETLSQIFSADGFYHLGYPLLLWLVRPFTADNAFLAGRVIAALAGAGLLGAGYWLARSLLAPGPALLALISLALSGLVAQYGLYLGSDMPFAAALTLTVAALFASTRQTGRVAPALAALAGLSGGFAFLIRHPGLLLLPWGLLAFGLMAYHPGSPRSFWPALSFGSAFLLAISPQLVVNLSQTGALLYSQQAKNIWLAVYADSDWQRWDEVPNTIALSEVVLADPARFLNNWWTNLVAFLGSGAEDTSEFGRALQLRLLGFPANWLAIAGLLWWLAALVRVPDGRKGRSTLRPYAPTANASAAATLLLLIGLYVAAVSTAFVLPRFFLPLAPIYAVAAAWALARLADALRSRADAARAVAHVASTSPRTPPSPPAGEMIRADQDGIDAPLSSPSPAAGFKGGKQTGATSGSDGIRTAQTRLDVAPLPAEGEGQPRSGGVRGEARLATPENLHKTQTFSPPSLPEGQAVRTNHAPARLLLGMALGLIMVLWGGYGAGIRYVLTNQPADEVAALALVRNVAPPEARFAARISARLPLAKYSAIAHRVVDWPIGSDLAQPLSPADLEVARAAGATHLLWDETSGLPPLDDPAAARLASTGRYAIYQLD